jgi:tetratricopeptide (TPR) repeat protein
LLQKDQNSIIVANNLASLLADYRTDKASLDRAQVLAAALRKSPLPQFKDTLGWVSYRQGDYKAAVSLLEDAAQALPNLALVHYHLGMSLLAAGQADKAGEQFKTALSQAPDHDLEVKIRAGLTKVGTQ